MALDPTAQRANRAEREKSARVLRELWAKAFETGRVEIPFESDCLTEANCIYESLKDYRKKIAKKSVEHFDIHCMINAVALKRPNPYLVVLEKKPEQFSGRTTAILNLIDRLPELDALNTKVSPPNIESILKDFRK
jgi:hypothetical protein